MTEFIDGIKVSDVGRLKENNFSLDDIDRKLFNAFAEQIFHTGFVLCLFWLLIELGHHQLYNLSKNGVLNHIILQK